MSDELKPCPFCGGEAKYWEYENEHDIFDPDSLGYVDTRYFIEHCVGCEPCKIVLARQSKDEAIAAWNARAERTFRMKPARGGGWYCSECSVWVAPGTMAIRHLVHNAPLLPELRREGSPVLALATRTWHIASISWGKDSLAMLLKLIELGEPLDEVVFFDTGMEFQAIYDTRDEVLPLIRRKGIHYTELRPKNPMWWSMFCRPVRKRGTDEVHKRGYSWCGGTCRWGTTEKQRALDRYAEAMSAVVYVGIAADETSRLEKEVKPYKRHPLADWGMTEADCLDYCHERGFAWMEGGISLYDVLDRVSCWCCRNKNLKELRAIHDHLPDYWARLVAMEEILGPMKKGKTLPEIGASC